MPTTHPTSGDTPASLGRLTAIVPDGAFVDSRSAIAYFLVRDLIVTLELRPGEVVVERELMERLDLGRTPVREALRRLGDEGLVHIYARRGTVVAPVHVSELHEVSEVRLELEALAARQAARRADARDHRDATDLLTMIRSRRRGQDPRELIRMDQRVHHCVHRATHNGHLQATLEEYLTLSLRLWFLGLDRVHRLDAAVTEHVALLEAVLEGDAARAETTARAHVSGFWQDIHTVLAPPPGQS